MSIFYFIGNGFLHLGLHGQGGKQTPPLTTDNNCDHHHDCLCDSKSVTYGLCKICRLNDC